MNRTGSRTISIKRNTICIAIALIPTYAGASALTPTQLNANAPIYFAIAEGFRLASYVTKDELERAELEKMAFNLYGRTARSEHSLRWRGRAKKMECLLNGMGVQPNYPAAYQIATALTPTNALPILLLVRAGAPGVK